MIEVIENPGPSLEAEVGEFLATQPRGACSEHDPRWLTVLREGLGHRTFVLVARGEERNPPAVPGEPGIPGVEGRIIGYLPLALVASRLFGRFLVSLPYLNSAGVISNDSATAAALIHRAVELAEEHDVQYLELRHGEAIEDASLGARRDEKVRMVLELPADAEALRKALGSKLMSQVRKGDRSELELKWGGSELLDDFYNVFAVNMRDLGTPVYPRKFFASILERLNDSAELAVTHHAKQPVAAALLIHHAPTLTSQVPSASALRTASHTNANMWMYHRMLLRAIERGGRFFDFGRSSVGSGTYNFKRQWGAEPHPTVWQYHVRRGDINAVRPDSPKYRRRIEAWQKLPVWLTRLIGPTIVRGIP